MTKKNGITLERHLEISKILNDIQETLLELAIEIGAAYPKYNHLGRAVKKINDAYYGVTGTICYMEENLYHDHPEKANLYIYYPMKKE